ncbi:MAG: hypothetical protein JRI68_21750 [Deltaproteobacteria bacterium]|nr:hypothetical protein [Deltaproteobacteria bacterium]
MARKLLTLGALGLGMAGCTSPSVTGVVEGEPVCVDFAVGSSNSLMKGSLRRPVQATILDGSTVRWERVLLGRRLADDPPSKFVVEDNDETYKMNWAQCPNIFAPKRVTTGEGRDADVPSSYTCGESKVYKELELHIKEGDASSRVLQWQVPPEPECWSNLAPDQAASAAASASAAPAEDPPDGEPDGGPEPASSASAAASGATPPPSSATPAKPSKPATPGKPSKPAAAEGPPPAPATNQ